MSLISLVGQLGVGNGHVVGIARLHHGAQLVGILQPILLSYLPCLVLGNHLNHVGLRVAQTNLITHDTVFHGVLEWGVEQHLHGLAFDKAHFHHTFAKSAMPHHLDDDACLACMQL